MSLIKCRYDGNDAEANGPQCCYSIIFPNIQGAQGHAALLVSIVGHSNPGPLRLSIACLGYYLLTLEFTVGTMVCTMYSRVGREPGFGAYLEFVALRVQGPK